MQFIDVNLATADYGLMSEVLRICDIYKAGLFGLFCHLIVTHESFFCNLTMDNASQHQLERD